MRAKVQPGCPTRDQLPPSLQASYDAAVEEWRSGRGRAAPPDDPAEIEALERHIAELRVQVDGF